MAAAEIFFSSFKAAQVVALALLTLWVFSWILVYIANVVSPPRDIVVAGVKGENDELTQLLLDRWNLWIVSKRSSSQTMGFFEMPQLTSGPILQKAREVTALEGVDLKFEGVDIPAAVRAAAKIVAAPAHTLHGEVHTHSDRVTLDLRLEKHGRSIKVWREAVALTDGEEGGDAVKKARVIEGLVDAAIFDMLEGFRKEPELEWWKPAMSSEIDLPNARALGAFYKGVEYLEQYRETKLQDDLERAERELRALTEEAPGSAQGWALLGMALAENRNETEAIHAYERALSLAKAGAPTNTFVFRIGLQRAGALTRRYKASAGNAAVTSLLDICKELDTARKASQAGGEDHQELTKLLALAHVQLAHTYGHYLAYLRHSNALELLHAIPTTAGVLEVLSAAEVAKLKDLRKSIGAEPNPKKREPLEEQYSQQLLDAIERVFKLHESALGDARSELGNLPSSADTDDIVYQLKNAEGNALYRVAHWRHADDDDLYRNLCRKAITVLDEANTLRPRHYAILENLGMIYLDERFDPSGEMLSIAQRYFTRAGELKPKDYYAHEQVAIVYKRRAARIASADAAKPLVEEGVAAVQRSLALRPQGSHVLLAELEILRWRFSDPKDREAVTERVERLLKEAASYHKDDPFYHVARAEWLYLLVHSGDGDAKIRARTAIAESLTVLEQAPTSWLVRKAIGRLLEIKKELDRPAREINKLLSPR